LVWFIPYQSTRDQANVVIKRSLEPRLRGESKSRDPYLATYSSVI